MAIEKPTMTLKMDTLLNALEYHEKRLETLLVLKQTIETDKTVEQILTNACSAANVSIGLHEAIWSVCSAEYARIQAARRDIGELTVPSSGLTAKNSNQEAWKFLTQKI